MSSEHGVVKNRLPLLESLPDLGQWVRDRGYQAYYTGKWHIPYRRVDQSFILLPGGRSYGEQGDSGVASVASGFLQQYSGNEPFFLNVGFLNPHDCCYLTFAPKSPAMKKQVIEKLREHLPPAPKSFDPNRPFKPHEGGEWNEDGVRLYNYYYYRMMEMVDAEIGRVYRALKNSRFFENTLFLFTADHGEMLGHQNQFKKGVFFESALRVPLVLAWPGRIPQNRKDDVHLVSGVDLPATILDYAEMDPMPDMSVARSLRPLLEDKKPSWREYVVAESYSGGPGRAVRTERYKAFLYQDGSSYLYDIKTDPFEKHDLARDSAYSDELNRCRHYHNEFVKQLKLHPDFQGFSHVPA